MDRKNLVAAFMYAGCLFAASSVLAMTPPPGALFPEGENMLYARVIQAYRDGKVADLGRSQEMLLKYFPKSSLGDNALYMRGLLELQKDRLAESLKSFDQIEKQFPLGNKRASALFAKGIVLKRLNLEEAATSVFDRITKEYPASVESLRAQTELKLLKSVSRQ